MGNRREPRVPTRMAVTVSGVDGDGNFFVQTAYASEVSRSGARLEGIGTLTRIGAKINVKNRGRQGQFCVVWLREARTSEPGQIGIRSLERGKYIWNMPKPNPAADNYIEPTSPEPVFPLPDLRTFSQPEVRRDDSAQSWPQKEQRKHPRRPSSGSARFRTPGGNVDLSGKLADVSNGGCYVSTMTPCPVGTRLELILDVPGVQLLIDGDVTTMHPTVGMGIEFSDLDDSTRDGLEQLQKASDLDH
jgi:hypothetical protein